MNGHDSTREQNMEARMMLAVARRPTRRPHVVLSTDSGGTIRRIRLSPGEIGCLAGILQTIANKGGRDDEPVG